jgi:hypothetical protein
LNEDGTNITNPDARFLQWKLELSSTTKTLTPQIKQVSISSMQMNLPPEIATITIFPQGEYYQNSDVDQQAKRSVMEKDYNFEEEEGGPQMSKRNNYLGRKIFRSNFRTVNWLVIDDNNDDLIFNLFYKQENDRTWKKLAQNWQSTSFAWDTERMPDGRYYLKLEASDSLSNPQEVFLKSEKISESFSIDNSGPEIVNLAFNKKSKPTEISFIVQDQFNLLKEVWYAVDGDDWKQVNPVDGILDSKNEKFLIRISSVQGKGKHELVIKALDTLKNINFLRTHFED